MADWLNKFKDVFKKGKPLAESLHALLDPADPRVAIRPLGGDWLCPFTGMRLETPDWDGSSKTVLKSPTITEHLLKQPELQKLGSNSQMKTWNELMKITLFIRFDNCENYKASNEKGEWVCPYCLEETGIILINWDGSTSPMELFRQETDRHFDKCPEYQQDSLSAKSLQEMKNQGGERGRIFKLLKTDPRFQLADGAGSWFCPFSERVIPGLNIKREAWDAPLQNKIVDYLLGPDCPGKYSQWKVERSVDELKATIVKNASMKPI